VEQAAVEVYPIEFYMSVGHIFELEVRMEVV
jgi:hypothetical protein